METNQEKKMEPPKYITHTSNELRLSDLEKTVTLDQVDGALKNAVDSVALAVNLSIDHWTDDEGLHRTPFESYLKDAIEEALQGVLVELNAKGGDS